MKKNSQLRKNTLSTFIKLRTAIVLGTFLIMGLITYAQTPQTIHFQGMLNDGSGTAMNESKSLDFRIYSTETGGSPLWSELHTNVEISEGLFSVTLGETNSLSGYFQNSPVYITFVVDGEEMLPRQKFQSVPYSILAKDAEQAYWADDAGNASYSENAGKLNNITSDGFVQQDGAGNATLLGTMNANAFVGDGSGLTNLPAASDYDWTRNGNYLYTLQDSVGIGTNTPLAPLEVFGRISQIGTGSSVILGEKAGLYTVFNNHLYNVYVGYAAGRENISGEWNTGIGTMALKHNLNGTQNTAFGFEAMQGNTSGHFNVALGSKTLYYNSSGDNNVSVGYSSSYMNSTGSENIAIGVGALYENSSGNVNVAIGAKALFRNTEISNLVAIGDSALYNNGVGAFFSSDGKYNTAVGSKTLFTNKTGSDNTAIGYRALYSCNSGSNTAIGANALYNNETGSNNTATGSIALYSNTTGSVNSAYGQQCLRDNTTGNWNVAVGGGALMANTTGSENIVIGTLAMEKNTSGSNSVAIGCEALYENTIKNNLVAIGNAALYHNGTGATLSYHAAKNTAIGNEVLYSNTTGYNNTAVGYQVLYTNSSGYANTAIGEFALYSNTNGKCNTAIGGTALNDCTGGDYNTASGHGSMHELTTGNYNTANGFQAMYSVTSGSYNTALGHYAYYNNNYTNSTAIGDGTQVSGSNQVRIGYNVNSIGGPVAWSNLSDGRFKTDVQENVPGLEFIKQLRPVTYHFDAEKLNNTNNLPEEYVNNPDIKNASAKFSAQTFSGFIAQEVEAVAENLNYNFSGVDKPENPEGIYGLRYAEFVVPLVKAVQEQQEIIENQNATIEQLMQRIEKLEQSK